MTIKQQGGIFGRNPTFNDTTTSGLTVNGSADLNSNATITSSGATVLGVVATGSNDSRIRITAPNDRISYLEFADPDDGDTGEIRYSHSTDTMQFRTNGNSIAAEFTSSGNLAFPSGQGIDFSATAGTGTSELFDDYEEGTWTPVPADAASSGNTGTATTAQGEYTKIGNLVYIKCYFANISTTSLTAGNDFHIQGLPYTAANTAAFSMNFGVCTTSGGVAFNGTIHPLISDNSASIKFAELKSSTNLDYLLVSEVTSGSADIWLSATYQAS